ncbi:MAG TPA: hypothetical protein VNH11_25955 [Pirellulales bacterium]|nr:hypothetical protein [Pirellulales bacterium]
MRHWRWLGQKLAERGVAITKPPSASDAPVVTIPGHRLAATLLKGASRYLPRCRHTADDRQHVAADA